MSIKKINALGQYVVETLNANFKGNLEKIMFQQPKFSNMIIVIVLKHTEVGINLIQ